MENFPVFFSLLFLFSEFHQTTGKQKKYKTTTENYTHETTLKAHKVESFPQKRKVFHKTDKRKNIFVWKVKILLIINAA